MGTIAVLGTGGSINDYQPIYDFAIGVNDIWKFVKTDAIVCLDDPKAFNHERLKVINESRPVAFYSQKVVWDSRPDFKKIDITRGYPETFLDLDLSGYYKSYCSPFVAVQVAFKLYETNEIHLFGIDLLNHPHLDQRICRNILRHFQNLKNALNRKGCSLAVHGNGILTALT